jgi:hypothetical protein
MDAHGSPLRAGIAGNIRKTKKNRGATKLKYGRGVVHLRSRVPLHKSSASLLLTLALLPGLAQAAWTLRYDGPDVVTLMSRPNGVGSNARSANVETRDVARLGLELMLAPVFETAFASCDLSDVDEVAVAPVGVADTLGDTTTHLHGLGMYVSLPVEGQGVGQANWFIAPFMAFQVRLLKGGKPVESTDTIFQYVTWTVNLGQEMTEEQFFKIKTDAVEDSLFKFAKQRMPAAMKSAFPKRCK